MINQLKDVIVFENIPIHILDEASLMISKSLSTTVSHSKPFIIHLCGIPGSGKSEYAKKLFPELLPGTYLLAFDTVMESLSGYQRDIKTLGVQQAFCNWESIARNIGYHILEALIAEKRSILFDHSASFTSHIDLLSLLINYGYRVEMHQIECPVKLADKRILQREKIINRHTPSNYVVNRYDKLVDLIPQYQQLVHKFKIIKGY